jgi:hypothetical protein
MRVILTCALFVLSSLTMLAGTLILEGKYQGKDLYVVNSVSSSGVGYCVFEVLVNGQISSDEWNSPAFEIDLDIYGLQLGDDLVITIKYKEGCLPKVINPGVLEPQPTYQVLDISISDFGVLTWGTIGETGSLPFVVQQFKWNKWVNVGEVMGRGIPGENTYKYQAAEVSGVNKFRVLQKTGDGDLKSSVAVEYTSSMPPVSVVYDKKGSTLTFSRETNYELYNVYGQIVKRGFGAKADLADMLKNDYYISFDNNTEKFYRK